jgi:XTP/dITP diphosphohydrolase
MTNDESTRKAESSESSQTVQHLIVATRNAHKTREIQRILGADFTVRDLSAYPEIPETVETGKTFEENAVLKATVVSRQLPGLVVADDSGLEVEALGGAPGIYSARYAGQNASDKQNIDKLLAELARIERAKRSARFCCVIALAREGKLLGSFEGVVEGVIIDSPRGTNGFGYDPIFVPQEFEQTFGELPAHVKDRISHRGRAIRLFADRLAALRPSRQGLGGGGGAPGGGAAPGCC